VLSCCLSTSFVKITTSPLRDSKPLFNAAPLAPPGAATCGACEGSRKKVVERASQAMASIIPSTPGASSERQLRPCGTLATDPPTRARRGRAPHVLARRRNDRRPLTKEFHEPGRDSEIGWSFHNPSAARGLIKSHYEGFSGRIDIH